jgi:hypothetical protein
LLETNRQIADAFSQMEHPGIGLFLPARLGREQSLLSKTAAPPGGSAAVFHSSRFNQT